MNKWQTGIAHATPVPEYTDSHRSPYVLQPLSAIIRLLHYGGLPP